MTETDRDWPAKDLQSVPACPACGSANRTTLYNGLEDIVFRCAPGKWTMISCMECGSAYLDPCATPASIGRAYQVYYTHTQEGSVPPAPERVTLWQKMLNGRLNRLYGFHRQPSSRLGGWVLSLIPFVQSYFDPRGRSVEKPPTVGAKLLDFGCGDGHFLALAAEAGWSVEGIDFDPKAVAAARGKGLAVEFGGVEALAARHDLDAVSMSHVIEHVYEPDELLSQVYESLKPGGVFWIETPNINSYGHRRYGHAWRGLEAPRHLTIYNESSLEAALRTAGFRIVESRPPQFVSLHTYRASRRLLRGSDPYGARSKLQLLDPAAIWDGVKALFFPSRSEFLRFRAVK